MKRFVLSLLFIACALATYARKVDPLFGDTIDRTADDFVIASLCVADPTDWRDDFYGIWGHAWIRLQCKTFNMDYCYSYESEPIEGNEWRYVIGDLKMGMYCMPTQDYIKDYQKWNRSVHEYRLNLPPAAKQRLWEIMDNKVKEGNLLKFDLIRRGCSITAAKFIINAIKPDTITYDEWPDVFQKSRREILMQAIDGYPWHQLLFAMFVPSKLEQKCSNEDKLVYASLLADTWEHATLNGQPLLQYVGELSTGEQILPHVWFTPQICLISLILMILCIIGGVLIHKKRVK